MLKTLKTSAQVSDITTVQYLNVVLEAYGIVPVKDCFPSSCSRSVRFKQNQSTVQNNHYDLPRLRETAKHRSEEEHSMNAKETQIPLTVEQPSHSCPTDKLRAESAKNDVLKACGII